MSSEQTPTHIFHLASISIIEIILITKTREEAVVGPLHEMWVLESDVFHILFLETVIRVQWSW